MTPSRLASPFRFGPPETPHTPFQPPPAELSDLFAAPREPADPHVDAVGRRFFMELDWTDRAEDHHARQ